VERWRPGVLVDTFAGGATAAKTTELERSRLHADLTVLAKLAGALARPPAVPHAG
jgi:hypothetical protein